MTSTNGTTTFPYARPLIAAAALLLSTGAQNNCQPNTLPNDPGLGPIEEAPANTWTWVDVDGAVCADGSPTGIGVNPGSSDVLFIYLQGGGGCWDEQTCVSNPTASHLDGFGLDEFRGAQAMLSVGPFARADNGNPLRDANMAFVPYCTGDVHAGDAVTNYGGVDVHHKGYVNMGHYLSRIQATFPHVKKVVLAGSSAGGIGSLVNASRTQETFGNTPVHVISDAGILLPSPYTSEPLEQAWRSAWNLSATLPADCTACDDDLTAIYGHVANTNARVGIISKKQDNVIPSFLNITLPQYEEALYSLAPIMDASPNLHYFVDDGIGHVMLTIGWHGTTAGGESLSQWTGKLVNDDPAWTSVID
jgi:hypothetical protein